MPLNGKNDPGCRGRHLRLDRHRIALSEKLTYRMELEFRYRFKQLSRLFTGMNGVKVPV